jgi:hypothetical protein
MNRHTIPILLFLVAIIFSSCKKDLSGVDSKKIGELNILPIEFDYLNTKSKIRFQNDDKVISVTATIRIKKDSLIWISLSPALGIEAARVMITQDSLKVMNRIEREYKATDYSAISKEFNFDINFQLIQAMLLGDMPISQRLQDQVSKKSGYFIIHQEQDNLVADNYIDGKKMKTERVQLTESSTNNTLTLMYDNFQTLSTFLIPYSNKIILNYTSGKERKTTLVDIDHGKAEIADASLKFPFNIPQKYDHQ